GSSSVDLERVPIRSVHSCRAKRLSRRANEVGHSRYRRPPALSLSASKTRQKPASVRNPTTLQTLPEKIQISDPYTRRRPGLTSVMAPLLQSPAVSRER